ncbi:MAG: type II toxin-antitoxin system VapC family toxin [Planctomycetota bacterium]
MRRYLLDTNAASQFVHHSKLLVDRARGVAQRGDRVGIATPVLGELFAGVETSQRKVENRRRVIAALRRLVVWPFDNVAAEEYGRLFAALRRIGRPMRQIDIQIAAVALTLGNCTVVSSDKDLQAVPGLRVEDWSAV